MMDELVQDLVSALEQASEQSKLEELWGEMIPSPLQQRRQIRRRRGRKRVHESSLYPMAHRRCWIEASESSMDEAKEYRKNLPSTFKTSLANNSDSDDPAERWPCVVGSPARSRRPSWPESDSFTENNPGRPLRRRRKVKRMTSDVRVRFQQKLHVRNDGRKRPRLSKVQRLSGPERRLSGWIGAERPTEGGRLMGKERWKRKMAKEHRDAPDENMSDGETSSTCSSDPGLFTNDEGRQGDDEQSDWFFEGDCGVGKAVTGLLPTWDSDNSLSLEERHTRPNFLQPARCSVRGYHTRPDRLLCSAACCFRRDRRRLPRKSTNMPVFVERLRHFSQDQCQRNFWLPPVGKQDRNQLSPLCPVCPTDTISERCPSSFFRNRQSNFSPGLFCSADTKRRREAEAVSITASASTPFLIDHQKEEVKEGASNTPALEAVGPTTPQFSASAQPESLSLLHEDT
ncbi:G patch domain-containing protein 2-like [Kryptolebias marmoratus]|nr:G patch domain-containing protein 2-like [Kryptolebias marmoratus]XP_037833783.1 G patch domain-containing protein 2-like [Kryptolebias marmoratus]XP_037833784.1 G patch domain-containing protein 2-like [Kryptolebias marmoratus]